MGPVTERENGLREKTERRKVDSVQVKSHGYGGLLSCAVFFSVPHPVTKGQDISSPPSLSTALSLSLVHICTGERTAVQWVWVGALKVRFAWLVEGVHM